MSDVEDEVEVNEVNEVEEVQLTGKKKKKFDYRAKLNKYFDEYKSILLINIDNVGSNQMQKVRIALRGKAVMLMGKNTMIRAVIRDRKDKKLDALLPYVVENIGFVFTNGSLAEVKKTVEEAKVSAAAKTGTVAPNDVFVPPGATGMDPGQTQFFAAMQIATKIERGNISILNEVHLLKTGDKITSSHVVLLQKLNILPFFYGIKTLSVYENGSVFDAKVLLLSQNDIANKFMSGVAQVAALSFETGFPTACSVPFQMRNAFKLTIALATEATGYTFKLMDKFLSGAAAAAAPAAAEGAAKGAAKEAAKEESEEESSGGAIFGAMGGDMGAAEESEYEEE